MVLPLIVWGGVVVGGLWVAGKAADDIGDAAEKSADLAKWATIGGAVYVSYRALKAYGAIK